MKDLEVNPDSRPLCNRGGSRRGVEGVATPFEEHLSLVICFILHKLIINEFFLQSFSTSTIQLLVKL